MLPCYICSTDSKIEAYGETLSIIVYGMKTWKEALASANHKVVQATRRL